MASTGTAADRWMNAAALATWFIVGLPTLIELASGRLAGRAAVVWAAAFLSFGAALVAGLSLSSTPRGRRLLPFLFTVQAAAGLTMVATTGDGTTAATLVVVAAEVASHYPPRSAWIIVALQTVALAAVRTRYDSVAGAMALAGAFGAFQAFAVTTMLLAERERRSREELGRAHAELLATRTLLAENSRVSERVRIARDLHDTLGHHLTALSLQLDVASRLTSGQAQQHVEEAHAIARLLLGDVRTVVSEMRDAHTDLAAALRPLAAGAGEFQIHLDLPDRLPVDAPVHGHVLVRAVQEIITNTARHAQASNLWIRIARTDAGIALHARDDGRGAANLTWGNGLRGMRERFEEQAGRLAVTAGAGRGFEIRGFLPRVDGRS